MTDVGGGRTQTAAQDRDDDPEGPPLRPSRTCPLCGADRVVSAFGAEHVFSTTVDGDYWCSACGADLSRGEVKEPAAPVERKPWDAPSGKYDLGTVPDVDPTDEVACIRYAENRGAYLADTVGLREAIATALGYCELGYSHSGISNFCDVTESTVNGWMATVADRFGERTLETRPQRDPVEVLE